MISTLEQMRCASMEPRRLSALLDFFIKHFIKMAECCHVYGATPQKTAYIEQAERLSVLLFGHPSHMDVAKKHMEKLCSLRRRVANVRTQSEPPKTPRRNPDMPIFTRPMNDPYQSTEFQEESSTSSNSDRDWDEQTNRQITAAVIHENKVGRSKIVDSPFPESETIATRDTLKKNRTARVVSLSDEPEESYLTETTYI